MTFVDFKPSLSVLVPIAVTDAVLISSTVPESEHGAWNAGTAYAVGDRCISTTTHRIYESVKAGNTGKDPTDLANQSGTTAYWLDIGPTNRWAMFDSEVSTQTEATPTLTIVLRPGFFSGFYLCGLDAEAISATVRDAPGGNVIYTYSGALEASAPADYDEYFFDPFKPQSDFLATGIEQYSTAELTLTLSRSSGPVKCGMAAIGDLRGIGKTLKGAKAKPKTYSYIKTDEFGKTSIKRRKAATDMSLSALLPLSEANSVTETLQSVLDVPCAWIGTNLAQYRALRVFGLGSGEVSFDHDQFCLLTLDVQGMI